MFELKDKNKVELQCLLGLLLDDHSCCRSLSVCTLFLISGTLDCVIFPLRRKQILSWKVNIVLLLQFLQQHLQQSSNPAVPQMFKADLPLSVFCLLGFLCENRHKSQNAAFWFGIAKQKKSTVVSIFTIVSLNKVYYYLHIKCHMFSPFLTVVTSHILT